MSRWLEQALTIVAENGHVETVEIAETPYSDPIPGVSTVSTVSTNDISGDFEERAAIVQEGARVPEGWAVGFATLAARPPPRGVDPTAWLGMMDAAGRFLDEWASKADALGWSAGELFGLNPDAPMNRLDQRGAAFFLVRAEVVAITGAEITIRKGGSIQRIPRTTGRGPPAWEPAA